MNPESEPIEMSVKRSEIYSLKTLLPSDDHHHLTSMILAAIVALSLPLLLGGVRVAAEELSPDRFRRMVRKELDKKGSVTDSIGTPLKVTGFGDGSRSFWLAPVLRVGKLIGVYEDDRKRDSVALVVNEPLLKSVRANLFDQAQVRQLLQERGFAGGDPMAVSFGPFSLFGVMQAGWYQDVGDSFVLLSLEGRLVSESEVSRLWPGKLPEIRLVKNRAESKK